MESNALTYFNEIPDEYLVFLAKNDWGLLEEICVFLTLGIKLDQQEKLIN